MKNKVLFICKHNRFRSKIAEALFRKLNKNKNNTGKGAGLIKGSPVNPKTKKICKKYGVNIRGFPKGLTYSLLKWQNCIVIVADNVPKSIFRENKKHGKRLIVWKIPDVYDIEDEKIGKVVKLVKKKMEKFVRSLK